VATTLIEDITKQLNDLHDGDVWLDETFAKKFEQINETNSRLRREFPALCKGKGFELRK